MASSRVLTFPEQISSDVTKLAECEFYLIEELDACLIVHHPYNTLTQVLKILELSPSEEQVIWSVINDMCVTDLSLLWPPHILAFAAILMGALTPAPQLSFYKGGLPTLPPKIADFFAQSEVDMDGVADCIQKIVTLYDLWKSYKAKEVKDILLATQ